MAGQNRIFFLERDARVETFTAAFGGNYARSEIRCELLGRERSAFDSCIFRQWRTDS